MTKEDDVIKKLRGEKTALITLAVMMVLISGISGIAIIRGHTIFLTIMGPSTAMCAVYFVSAWINHNTAILLTGMKNGKGR